MCFFGCCDSIENSVSCPKFYEFVEED